MKNKKLLSVVLSGSMLLSSMATSMTVFATEGGVFNSAIANAKKAEFKGEKFTAKPLVILMDFQDYKHEELDKKEDWRINSFKGSETTKEFYQELFFGKDYYTTADGQKHMTVRKFYEEESGGVYDFDGTVAGWYMAKGNAIDYGKGGEDQKLCRDGLVKEAIAAAAKDLDLSQFDVEDKWDLDGDGNYNEPDGIIDSIVVIHPGLGQEWGGGSLGDDAIWPFRWGYNMFGEKNNVDKMTSDEKKAVIAKNPTVTDKSGNTFSLEDFTVFEQDLPVDLFCHEFGHVLGLPDLYDARSWSDVPVENWSIMGGSYTGNPRGSQPVSYGAYCRQFLQHDFVKRGRKDSNWQKSETLNLSDITSEGLDMVLDQASLKGSNHDTIRVNLPEKHEKLIAQPTQGSKFFFSGCADNLENYMTTKAPIDLTSANAPELSMNAWYDLDPKFDFASVQVREFGTDKWVCLQDKNGLATDKVDDWVSSNESKEQILHRNPGWGFTGKIDTWTDISFDLSAYKGKKIDVRFRLATDDNGPYSGFFFDKLKVNDGNNVIFEDDAEGEEKFEFNGFYISDGTEKEATNHYYLLEWRNKDNGLVDQGLGCINIGRPGLQYDAGLVVWYINEKYNDFTPNQDVSAHPGAAYATVIDADQNPVMYKYVDGRSGADRVNYQMHDAAFSLRKGSEININGGSGTKAYSVNDNNLFMNPYFKDSNDYTGNYGKGITGVSLKEYGLNVFVTEESSDRSSAKIHIAKATKDGVPQVQNQNEIKRVDLEDGKVAITTDKQYGKTAHALLVKGSEKQELTLNYDNGQYVANAKTGEGWKVSFIILTDAQNNAKAIYNSNENGLYGINMEDMATTKFQAEVKGNEVATTLCFDEGTNIKVVRVLVGAYDDNGKLISSSVQNVDVIPGKTLTVNSNINISESVKTLKVFLWEAKPGFGPLKRAIVKNIR